MADNVQLNAGVGGEIAAADDISGVKYQRVKLTLGSDGVNDGDVSATNPIPVSYDSLKAVQDAIQAQTEVMEYALMALLDKISMPDRYDRTRVMIGDTAGNEISGAYYGINVASVGDTSTGKLWSRLSEPWHFSNAGCAYIYNQIAVT